MKYLKSLAITAKNKYREYASRYVLLDLEAGLKNMEMNKTLITNFLEATQPLFQLFSGLCNLKDEMNTQFIKNMKEKKEIEKNEMYQLLCDIYSGIDFKIKAVYGNLANIITLFVELESEFKDFITKINKSLKKRKQLISDFVSEFKEYRRNENSFSSFIYSNKTETEAIKNQYKIQQLEKNWLKINKKQKQIFEKDETILELFPENLVKLLEYSGYTQLIDDKQKQKYEKLLFGETENIKSFYKTNGKFMEVQPFWPKFFEEIMIKRTTDFDVVKKMFGDFKEYLGNEKEQKELLIKCNIFQKLKKIFFDTSKDPSTGGKDLVGMEPSFNEFDSLDKKLVIIDYLNANRNQFTQGKMEEKLLNDLVPIFKEVQNYIIKTSYYEEEDLLFIMAETFKYVKEEKNVYLIELLKKEKKFINEEFATNYIAFIITKRIDEFKNFQDLLFVIMGSYFGQLKNFFVKKTLMKIFSNALEKTNHENSIEEAYQLAASQFE